MSESQEAIKELFDRTVQRYLDPDKQFSDKEYEKFAKEFIRIQKNLSDGKEKFFCQYFIGAIRYNQGKYGAALDWFNKAKEIDPEKAYIFMDMYSYCVFDKALKSNEIIEAMPYIQKIMTEAINFAIKYDDQEACDRLRPRLKYWKDNFPQFFMG